MPDDQTANPQDIFIPKPLIHGAVDGDRVECYIDEQSRSKKGPEGGVLSILDRGRSEIAVTIDGLYTSEFYQAYAPALGNAKHVLLSRKKYPQLEVGDRLLVKVTHWGDKNAPVSGDMIEHLGHISDPKTDIPAALYEFSIPHVFPKKAVEEAKKYGKSVRKEDLQDRTDLTDLETFTIDPKTAKDFDDALSLTIDTQGHYTLFVHIADVSHYVQEGTTLDKEAKFRANSTYFPRKCIPMIPHELSDNLCSLREKVIRLTVTVEMEFSPTGDLLRQKIYRAFIKSNKRFTYEEAFEVIEGERRSKHAQSLHNMVKLCQILKEKRAQRGSVDLALKETVIIVDEDGSPTGTEVVDYDITHQLVEEFMLKANEIVASEFVKKGMNTTFRIHEEPMEETMKEFYALGRLLGFELPAEPSAHDVQRMFNLAKHTEFAERISIAYIRSMKLAVYSHENVGHFGLALEHYCHFTSPIRRYADLVVHRMLFSGTAPEDLQAITAHISEKERNSFKAEQSVLQLKKLRMIFSDFDADPYHIFKGVVAGVKPHGIYFDLHPMNYSGYVHISKLGDDYYEYAHERGILYGTYSGHELALGESIELQLVSIDLIRGETEWELYSPVKKRSSKKKKEKKRHRKKEGQKKRRRSN